MNNNNKFGGVAIGKQHHNAVFVNESKTGEMYASIWETLPTNEKRLRAQSLKIVIPESVYNKTFDELSSSDIDMVWPIITFGIDESLSTHIAKIVTLSKSASINEGLITWMVGAVILRKIWQKISKSYKSKILKSAGVPDNLIGQYNKLAIDALPLTYKDAVMHALQKSGVSINESDESKAFIEAYKNASNELKFDVLSKHDKFADLALEIDEIDAIENAYDSMTADDKKLINQFIGIDEDASYSSTNKTFADNVIELIKTDAYYRSKQGAVIQLIGFELEKQLHTNDKQTINDVFSNLTKQQQNDLSGIFNWQIDIVSESMNDNANIFVDALSKYNATQQIVLQLTIAGSYDLGYAFLHKDVAKLKDNYLKLSRAQREMLHQTFNVKFVDESNSYQTYLDYWDTLSNDERHSIASLLGYHTDELNTSFDELPKEDRDATIKHWHESGVLQNEIDEACSIGYQFKLASNLTAYNADKQYNIPANSLITISHLFAGDNVGFTLQNDSTVYSVSSDALAKHIKAVADESLSDDGKIAYSTAGVAYPTASIKAILHWLCYDNVVSTSTIYASAQVWEITNDMQITLQGLQMPSIVKACGTPDLQSIKTPTMQTVDIKSGYFAVLLDNFAHATLVVPYNGDWFISQDVATLNALIKQNEDANMIYDVTRIEQLPPMKRQSLPTLGFASLIMICKRFASKADDNGIAGVLQLTTKISNQVNFDLHPSFAKNIIAAPSTNEFLSKLKTVVISPNCQYPYIWLQTSNVLYIDIDNRWYMTKDANTIESIMSAMSDAEQLQKNAKQIVQLTQYQINEILQMWLYANPLLTIATLRTKSTVLIVNETESLTTIANVDVPASFVKDGNTFILSFMYNDTMYKMTIWSIDELKASFDCIQLFEELMS